MELLRVDHRAVAAAEEHSQRRDGRGVVGHDTAAGAGEAENAGVSAFAEHVDPAAGDRRLEGGEHRQEHRRVADAAGTDDEHGPGHILEAAMLRARLRTRERLAEQRADEGVGGLHQGGAEAHRAPFPAAAGRGCCCSGGGPAPASMRASMASASAPDL